VRKQLLHDCETGRRKCRQQQGKEFLKVHFQGEADRPRETMLPVSLEPTLDSPGLSCHLEVLVRHKLGIPRQEGCIGVKVAYSTNGTLELVTYM
jgi:hypothetical protein